MLATAPRRATPTAATQPPPLSVQDYEFSYSRPRPHRPGLMRFRLAGEPYLCETLAGDAEALGVRKDGTILARCKVQLQGYKGEVEGGSLYASAYTWLPKDVAPSRYEAMVVGLEPMCDSHVRCCFNREASERLAEPHFRVRDERTQILYSDDIRNFVGIFHWNWLDGGPHVFHDGKVYHLKDTETAVFLP